MRAYRKIDEPYELKIEGGRLALLGVGAVLTLVLVFLVGVLVGKGLWGARGGSGTALLATSPTPVAAEPVKPQYTFYKDLTQPEAEVQGVEPPAPERAEAVAGTPVSPAGSGLSAPAGTNSAPTGANSGMQSAAGGSGTEKAVPPARSEQPKEAVAGVAPPKAATQARPGEESAAAPRTAVAKSVVLKGGPARPAAPKAGVPLPTPAFTVQVGSFRDRASADDQAKKIVVQGVSAQVVLVSVEGRTWYRVQVGRFDTRADAEAYYQKKLRPGGVQGFVTAR